MQSQCYFCKAFFFFFNLVVCLLSYANLLLSCLTMWLDSGLERSPLQRKGSVFSLLACSFILSTESASRMSLKDNDGIFFDSDIPSTKNWTKTSIP